MSDVIEIKLSVKALTRYGVPKDAIEKIITHLNKFNSDILYKMDVYKK